MLENILSAVETLLEDFLHDRNPCTFDYNAIHYGILTKELCIRGLLFPRPQNPFLGYSFDNISKSIRKITDFEFHNIVTEHWPRDLDSKHYCSLEPYLMYI